MSKTYIFDIETEPLPHAELLEIMPPFAMAEVKLGNIKDPEKIAAKLIEAEESHRAEFFERAALDPLTGRVLCIGIMDVTDTGEDAPQWQPKIIHNEDEAAMLRRFWQIVRNEHGGTNVMVGFNSNQFDLPFLIRRSWKLRVTVPHNVRPGKWWGENMIDLRDTWQLGDRQAKGSLDAIAKHLGIGSKAGNGKDFSALWHRDQDAAIQYLFQDLNLTAKAAEVMGVI